jgi:membrane protease YdiL (CAAX protease family)
MFKMLKVVLLLLALSITLLGAPRIGRLVANLVGNNFDISIIDPDGAFFWMTIRHTVQALVILVFILVLNKTKGITFGLGLGNKEVGIKSLKKFMLFFSIYTFFAFLSVILLGNFQPFHHDLTPINIAGYLGFQLFMSGPSEELIFRAFAMTIAGMLIPQRLLKNRVSLANIYAAIIFGIAHMAIVFFPFSISYSPFQVVYAMVLGIFYGDVYEKSQSFVYPMIMHSFTNVLMMGTTIILSFIL